ncbi:FadR/GntR family transcriptional regulator [Peribacillus alkalitolerans]|uniref:FadR/GntR family transcriptional regulator n=1 Tax=Peribacillus alkalitolerans TaxID=1550385 RepID=UPI001F07E768|nr:GntR family transcriptional regulator [Peribacillus alkalitolerans]
MTTNSNVSSKIYLEIVEKLRAMIDADGLVLGDKIPSERELSDRLSVGRSSVREALRALELLGLIETRRGEGTFIKDFQEHRLVDLLGAFFLQDQKTIDDLSETKHLIELDCLKLLIQRGQKEKIDQLLNWAKNHSFDDSSFFETIAITNPNKLLERIWRVIHSYERSTKRNVITAEVDDYLELLDSIQLKDEIRMVETYLYRIRKLSKPL